MKIKKEMFSLIGALTILAFLPLMLTQYLMHIFILCFLFGVLALNFDLLYGYLGQLNLGYGASLAVGAYTSALCAIYLGISPWLGLILGGASSIIITLPIGLCGLRLRSHYFAIITLLLGEVLRLIYSRPLDWLTKGETGLWGVPWLPSIGPIDFSGVNRAPVYYLTLFIMALAIFIDFKLIKSKTGIAFITIKKDETVAETLGINSLKYKLIGFAISTFFAGLVGAVFAHYLGIVSPDLFTWKYTGEILTMALIGGSGTIMGPILGSFIAVLTLEGFRIIGVVRFIIYGLLIVVIIVFWPEGAVGVVKHVAIYFRKKMQGVVQTSNASIGEGE